MAPLPIRTHAATRRIAVRVTEHEYCAITRLARMNSVTLSGMIGEALAEYASDLGEAAPTARLRVNSCLVCPACRVRSR